MGAGVASALVEPCASSPARDARLELYAHLICRGVVLRRDRGRVVLAKKAAWAANADGYPGAGSLHVAAVVARSRLDHDRARTRRRPRIAPVPGPVRGERGRMPPAAALGRNLVTGHDASAAVCAGSR